MIEPGGVHEVGGGRAGTNRGEHSIDDRPPARELVARDRVGRGVDDPRRAEVGRVAVQVDAGIDPEDVARRELLRARRDGEDRLAA